jgi:hypothetical protein
MNLRLTIPPNRDTMSGRFVCAAVYWFSVGVTALGNGMQEGGK